MLSDLVGVRTAESGVLGLDEGPSFVGTIGEATGVASCAGAFFGIFKPENLPFGAELSCTGGGFGTDSLTVVEGCFAFPFPVDEFCSASSFLFKPFKALNGVSSDSEPLFIRIKGIRFR